MVEQIAPGLTRISLARVDIVNAYVLGDVLIDSSLRTHRVKLLRAREGRTLSAHAITHAHADHQGSSHHASARRLAALEPELVCFGHGLPLRDSAAFQTFVAGLPN